MPPPPATRPPACRDSDSPQPRSRGSMYCICASSTCALPSRLLACWAKMSRISAVRSTTLTLRIFSSWLSWPGVSSPSQITVSAPVAATMSRISRGLARADVGGGVGLVAALADRLEHLRAGGLGQRGELGERAVGVGLGALGPDTDQHDALEAQLPVLDLGDVGELGGEPGDAAERAALLEGVGPGASSSGASNGTGSGGCRRSCVQRSGIGPAWTWRHLSCHHEVQHIARPSASRPRGRNWAGAAGGR